MDKIWGTYDFFFVKGRYCQYIILDRYIYKYRICNLKVHTHVTNGLSILFKNVFPEKEEKNKHNCKTSDSLI